MVLTLQEHKIIFKSTILWVVTPSSPLDVHWHLRGWTEDYTLHSHHCNNPYSNKIILLIYYSTLRIILVLLFLFTHNIKGKAIPVTGHEGT
jgi:hypothetical protein